MAEDPIDQSIRQYIQNGAAEGAAAAAQRLSTALGISLSDVLEAVQKVGTGGWEPGLSLAGEGSVTVGAPAGAITVMAIAGTVSVSDGAGAADSLTVVRQGEVDEVSIQAAQGGGLARLAANQRILAAVILIAGIFYVLPPHMQAELLNDSTFAAALAAVLVLIKRS